MAGNGELKSCFGCGIKSENGLVMVNGPVEKAYNCLCDCVSTDPCEDADGNGLFCDPTTNKLWAPIQSTKRFCTTEIAQQTSSGIPGGSGDVLAQSGTASFTNDTACQCAYVSVTLNWGGAGIKLAEAEAGGVTHKWRKVVTDDAGNQVENSTGTAGSPGAVFATKGNYTVNTASDSLTMVCKLDPGSSINMTLESFANATGGTEGTADITQGASSIVLDVTLVQDCGGTETVKVTSDGASNTLPG